MSLTHQFELANEKFIQGSFSEAFELYKKSETNELLRDIAQINMYLCLKEFGGEKEAYRFLHEKLAKNSNDYLEIVKSEVNKSDVSECQKVNLSIIVPIYNSGKYLERCLQSILNQSFKNFELILVDDGSNDDSSDIIDSFSKLDSRIRVIKNKIPSGNPGTPRNQAISIAAGDFIGFVDSDDWIEPDFYEKLLNKAYEDSSDIVFSGGFYNVMQTGEIQERIYKEFDFTDRSSDQYKFHDSFMIWDKVFRTKFIKDLDIRLGETKAAVDVPFIFKAYYFAVNVSFIRDYLGYYYRRESTSSVTVAHRKNSSCEFEFEAFRAVLDWAQLQNVDLHYKRLIDIKMVSSLMYTLKLIGEDYFDSFFEKVKDSFHRVGDQEFKDFCIANKKWWLYKEFIAMRDGSLTSAKLFLEQKKNEALEKEFQKITEEKINFPGDNLGIMFFPCWTKNNPYQKLFYQAVSKQCNINISGFTKEAFCRKHLEENKDKFRYIHLHWLHVFMDFSQSGGEREFLDTVDYAKKSGYEIIYTAHNIISHDSEHVDSEIAARKKFIKHVDIAIAHGEAAKNILVEELDLDASKITIIPHGSYGDFYGSPVIKASARKRLGIPLNAYVFLFFGNIKGYKGVDELLNSFEKLSANHPNAHLLIAGRILDDSFDDVLRERLVKGNVTFYEGFVPDDMVKYYFSAANVCVLPYRKVLTSGAAMLSLSLNCPVIAPDVGVLPEIISDEVGTLFSDYDELYDIMYSYLTESERSTFHNESSFSELNRKLSWDNLVTNLNL